MNSVPSKAAETNGGFLRNRFLLKTFDEKAKYLGSDNRKDLDRVHYRTHLSVMQVKDSRP